MTFIQTIQEGYTFSGDSFFLGIGIQANEVVSEADIRVPFSTMNRHGLIAGAT